MNQMSSCNIAARHGETNDNFSGTRNAASATGSAVGAEVAKAYKKILVSAKKNETTTEQVAEKFLKRNLDCLDSYIRSKGEIPVNTNNGIIVQSALLRMQDIAVISTAGNLSEDDALDEIMKAESEAILLNTADKNDVLPPDVQAALNCIIVDLLKRMEITTGQGSIVGALSLIKRSMATPVNNLIGDDLNFSNLNPANTSAQLAATADTNGDSSESLWDTLNKIAATAQTVAKAIGSVSASTSGAILNVGNAVQTTGANTGASAISLYMQRNGITIVVIILIAIILIILLARVTSK
jgi:hypothetical protein